MSNLEALSQLEPSQPSKSLYKEGARFKELPIWKRGITLATVGLSAIAASCGGNAVESSTTTPPTTIESTTVPTTIPETTTTTTVPETTTTTEAIPETTTFYWVDGSAIPGYLGEKKYTDESTGIEFSYTYFAAYIGNEVLDLKEEMLALDGSTNTIHYHEITIPNQISGQPLEGVLGIVENSSGMTVVARAEGLRISIDPNYDNEEFPTDDPTYEIPYAEFVESIQINRLYPIQANKPFSENSINIACQGNTECKNRFNLINNRFSKNEMLGECLQNTTCDASLLNSDPKGLIESIIFSPDFRG